MLVCVSDTAVYVHVLVVDSDHARETTSKNRVAEISALPLQTPACAVAVQSKQVTSISSGQETSAQNVGSIVNVNGPQPLGTVKDSSNIKLPKDPPPSIALIFPPEGKFAVVD